MKLIKIFVFIFIISLFFNSCEPDKDPVLKVINKKGEFKTDGKYYFSFTVKNSGEEPAFLVFIQGKAFSNDKNVGFDEKVIGDIFQNREKTDTLIFDNLHYVAPDTIHIQMSYTPYM